LKVIPNYEAVIVRSRTKVTKEVINAGKRLKVTGRAGVGVDNIDMEAAKQRGIQVLNTPEAPAEAVAELALGLILTLARNISHADKAMKENKWIKKELEGWELRGKTLGIVGFGNIGKRLAKYAHALGMKIIVSDQIAPDPSLLQELEGKLVSLAELLESSDVVSIHTPYNPQTHHMIGEKELMLMKKSAYLINTSRGPIIDEEALLNALKSGNLGGAALDVFEEEPPTDWTLMHLPNVVCTPHIGAQTMEAQKAASTLLAEKIIGFFK
jgi:D-3-phosphoglycerate dehydrogenase